MYRKVPVKEVSLAALLLLPGVCALVMQMNPGNGNGRPGELMVAGLNALPGHSPASTRARLADLPLWYVGDSWSYRVTINVEGDAPDPDDPSKVYHIVAHIVADVTYTVSGIELHGWNGTQTYVYNVTMDGTIISKEGSTIYSWVRVSGLTSTDVMTFIEGSGHGFTWQRISDLATVRNWAQVHVQTDDPQLNGYVDATVDNRNFPPEEIYDFPMYAGDVYHLSSSHQATTEYMYELHTIGIDEGPESDLADGSYQQDDDAIVVGMETVNPAEDPTANDVNGDGNPTNDGPPPGMDQEFSCVHVRVDVPLPNSTEKGHKNYYYCEDVRTAVYFTAENFQLQETSDGLSGKVTSASAVLTAFTPGTETTMTLSAPETSVPGGTVTVSGQTDPGQTVTIQTGAELVSVLSDGTGYYEARVRLPESDGTPEQSSGAPEGVDMGSVGVVAVAGENYAVTTVRLYSCDLSPSEMTVSGSPDVLVGGTEYIVRAKVQNMGHGTVGNVSVRLLLDGSEIATEHVDTVYAGSFETVEFRWTPQDSGTHTLTVVVDPENAIPEDDERNNERSLEVSVNAAPQIALSSPAPSTVLTYEPFSLDASASSDPEGSDLSFLWDMGDGTTYSEAAITHHYEDYGNYTVSLTLTDSVGASSSPNWTLTVRNRLPRIRLLYGTERYAATDTPIDFDASLSTDRDGDIVSFTWDFGDGNDAVGATVSHAYAAEGSYTVVVTVTDDDGATNSTTISVEIANLPPELEGVVADSTSALPKSYVKFTLIGAKCYVMPQHTQWDFDYRDDHFTVDQDTGGVTYVMHSFDLVGTYTVAARIIDGQNRSTSVVTVTVEISVPDATGPEVTKVTANSVEGELTVSVGESVLFSASYTEGDQQVNFTEWNFGDGSRERGEQAVHTFSEPGNYTVTFRVIDMLGMYGEGTILIHVRASAAETGSGDEPGTNHSTGTGQGSSPDTGTVGGSREGSGSTIWPIVLAVVLLVVVVVVTVLVLKGRKGGGSAESQTGAAEGSPVPGSPEPREPSGPRVP